MTHSTTTPASLAASHRAAASSAFLVNVPDQVFQTFIDEHGRQDSSSLLHISITLSSALSAIFKAALTGKRGVATPKSSKAAPRSRTKLVGVDEAAAAESALLSDLIVGVIRRFDGREIETYSETEHCMQGLRLPPACFVYGLEDTPRGSTVLNIHIHRKYLPVSKSFGNARFVFAFVLAPASPNVEVVVTDSFHSCSKEPAPATATGGGGKAAPKRVRAPPYTKPVAAAPTPHDALVDEFFSALPMGGGGALVAPAVAASARRSEGAARSTPTAAAGVKRKAPITPPLTASNEVCAVAPASKRPRRHAGPSLSEMAAAAVTPLSAGVGVVEAYEYLGEASKEASAAYPLPAPALMLPPALARSVSDVSFAPFNAAFAAFATASGFAVTGGPAPSPTGSSSPSAALTPHLRALMGDGESGAFGGSFAQGGSEGMFMPSLSLTLPEEHLPEQQQAPASAYSPGTSHRMLAQMSLLAEARREAERSALLSESSSGDDDSDSLSSESRFEDGDEDMSSLFSGVGSIQRSSDEESDLSASPIEPGLYHHNHPLYSMMYSTALGETV